MAMSIFNEKQIEAMRSGKYICSKCGRVMELGRYIGMFLRS